MDTAEDGTPAPAALEDEGGDTHMEEGFPAAAEGNGTPGYRLFVGCVPPQFSEDDLKAHFSEVSHLLTQKPEL
jgi:hypothetical protein